MAKKESALVAAMAERDTLITRIDERASKLGLAMPPIAPLALRTGIELDERGDGVAVISLQGLRRLDAMMQELEDRRPEAEGLMGDHSDA